MPRRPPLADIVKALDDANGEASAAAAAAAVAPGRAPQQQVLNAMQKSLECPITCEIMRIPVVAEDGHTYEKEAIEEHLRRRSTSPMTNLPMGGTLTPNHSVWAMVEVWKALGGKIDS